jgi:hypothetical protein
LVQVEYPAELSQASVEAIVKLRLTIDSTGTVVAVKPITMPSEPAFYEVARKAALAQRWIPAKYDGRPVPAVVHYRFVFRMPPHSEAPTPGVRSETSTE